MPVLQNAFGQNIKILGRGRRCSSADSQNGNEPPAVVRIMSEGNEVPALWVLFRQARKGSRTRGSTLDCGEGVG